MDFHSFILRSIQAQEKSIREHSTQMGYKQETIQVTGRGI